MSVSTAQAVCLIDCNVVEVSYCVLQDQIVNELASNKVYLQGNDIQGRSVFVVLAKQQEMGRAEETKRFICYTLDNAIAAADPARNELRQFVCLFDLSGERQIWLQLAASIALMIV